MPRYSANSDEGQEILTFSGQGAPINPPAPVASVVMPQIISNPDFTGTPVYNPVTVTPEVMKVVEQQQTQQTQDMSLFSKIGSVVKSVGSVVGKAVGAVTKVSSIVLSPNPIMAAADALSGGAANQKKTEAINQADVQTQQKSIQQTPVTTTGSFMDKTISIFGFVMKLWIVIAVIVGILLAMVIWIWKKGKRKVMGRRRTSAARRARATKRRSPARRR
jgi:hypothetical protein